jgi:hypothetical protein
LDLFRQSILLCTIWSMVVRRKSYYAPCVLQFIPLYFFGYVLCLQYSACSPLLLCLDLVFFFSFSQHKTFLCSLWF